MNIFKTPLLLLLALAFTACVDDEDMVPNLDGVAAPTELDLEFAIASDNSGVVTIQPLGKGVTQFRVDFGDGEIDTVGMAPGETIDHAYDQGTYTVGLEAMSINGSVTSYTEELVVEFAAPRNLVATIERQPGNPFGIRVSATADLATGFQVLFGDDEDAEPVVIGIGESVEYAYAQVGEYEVCITAINGGSATLKTTETIVVSDPTLLPINFEDRNTEFFAFGGASIGIVDNPAPSEANNSARVAELVKTDGSETWAGTVVVLGESLDMSTQQTVSVRTWSPTAGTPVLLKLENAADDQIFVELTEMTTVANGWETMNFDFSSADLTREYSKVAIFFNFGTSGTGESYYFDDLRQTDGSPSVDFPLGFEGGQEFTFTGFGGGSAEVTDNPDVGTGNPSGRVVSFKKEVGSQPWGGVFLDLSGPLNFANNQSVKLKVWSPKAGAPILLKFENPDNTDQNIEVSVSTTVAGQWEELTYDFSGAQSVPNLARVVFFADFGTSGTDEAYYFDDFRFE